jgi:hypothetical protein
MLTVIWLVIAAAIALAILSLIIGIKTDNFFILILGMTASTVVLLICVLIILFRHLLIASYKIARDVPLWRGL